MISNSNSQSILLLETLNQEVDSIIKNMIDEEREHLTNIEVRHLIKMADHIVMKIKNQISENCEYI
jgi:hypothetical protein